MAGHGRAASALAARAGLSELELPSDARASGARIAKVPGLAANGSDAVQRGHGRAAMAQSNAMSGGWGLVEK